MNARILIADDHEVVREGIRRLLAHARPEWEICGEAENGRDAIDLVREQKPDVVVLDITMPEMSGLEAAKRISGSGLPSHILIFTMHEGDTLAKEIVNAGAQGYVRKSQAAQDLVKAIECLLQGGKFFNPRASVQPESRQ